MEVAGLVVPVFAIIVTGWLAGWLGYIPRSLADGLGHFAYNVAMPALRIATLSAGRACHPCVLCELRIRGPSIDHLVRANKKGRRNREAKGFSGSHVDREVEARWALKR
jgi:hypothetical protein